MSQNFIFNGSGILQPRLSFWKLCDVLRELQGEEVEAGKDTNKTATTSALLPVQVIIGFRLEALKKQLFGKKIFPLRKKKNWEQQCYVRTSRHTQLKYYYVLTVSVTWVSLRKCFAKQVVDRIWLKGWEFSEPCSASWTERARPEQRYRYTLFFLN